MPLGQFGKVRAFNDFTSGGGVTWAAGQVDLTGGWMLTSVNEGTMNTIAEPNGVLQFKTDTADNDNACLYAGPFAINQGGAVLEARIKLGDDLNSALFVGFSETMDAATPVMPAEFATATMTYNGSGGMIGAQYDLDGTTDDWRAVMADGGANTGGAASANGVRANDAPVADENQIIRVEVYETGGGAVYVDGVLVKEYEPGLTTTDLFYACVMIENRSAAANDLEVDYVFAEGGRDWTV